MVKLKEVTTADAAAHTANEPSEKMPPSEEKASERTESHITNSEVVTDVTSEQNAQKEPETAIVPASEAKKKKKKKKKPQITEEEFIIEEVPSAKKGKHSRTAPASSNQRPPQQPSTPSPQYDNSKQDQHPPTGS